MLSLSTTSLLILLPSWVGDAVMATPVLRAARLALPDARIIGAGRPGLDELLEGTPWLDEMLVEETKRLSGTLRLARRIRRLAPEAAIVLPNSLRSALVARLGGVRRVVGYRRSGRGPLLTDPVEPDRQRPIPAVVYYAQLAEAALGPGHVERRLELAVTDQQRETAQRLLDGVSRPFALLCPGAGKPAKRWPAERFAAVADALARRHGLGVVAAGSPPEQDQVQAVVTAAKCTVTDLAQRGATLGGLKAVIAAARLVVTNDTGPRHIAAALGTPAVTVFGPTDRRWTTIDSPREKTLASDPFLPEPLVADDHPARCAVTRIPAGDVLAASELLLAGTILPSDDRAQPA